MIRNSIHIPVLLNEVLELLKPESGEFFIDGTIDGGGHARALLEKLGPKGKLLGIDWDESMIEKLKNNPEFEKAVASKRLVPVSGNYADLPAILEKEKLPKADALLLDLGFSSEQLESSGRGFSFMKDEPLLMTYSDSSVPVKDILKRIDEKELADIIFQLSGERFSRRIATAIKKSERAKKIETTGELIEVIKSVLPGSYERGRIEPATRTFQALRIYANDEFKNIESVMEKLPEILNPGARVAVISFHSLEDRILKKCFRQMDKEGKAEILTPKPVRATRKEISGNPRSRSGMLRAIKLTNNQ